MRVVILKRILDEKKIIVIGAGAWGTALANLLAKNNCNICLIAKDEKVADEINSQKSNAKFLPNIVLSNNLKTATNLAGEAADADFIFVVTPSQVTAQLLTQLSQLKLKILLAWCFALKACTAISCNYFIS